MKTPYWKAVRRADDAFSKWVRYSNTLPGGAIKCYCGRIVPVEESDCSHYVDRAHMGTRYEENNCAPSCRSCNRFKEGNKDEFTLFLVKTYGQEILEELNQKKHMITKMDVYSLNLIADEYKTKLKALIK